MAQGTIKMTGKAPAPKATHSKKQISKAAGQAKKKKARTDLVHRKFTAGMAAKTEALLGERVGHLELIGKKKNKGEKRVAKAGGSKKFG